MISLLNKLGRRMVSDRGEKLNNPRLFSCTAKRVLSVLFLLILGFSFLPTFDIDVSAASGLSNVTYTVLEDGAVKVTATLTPAVINGSVGSAQLDALMIYSVTHPGFSDCNQPVSRTRLSGSARTVSTWEAVYYVPEDGTYNVAVRRYDGTTGTNSYVEHEQRVQLTGLKYQRDGTRKPYISNVRANPSATDKTKANLSFSIWHVGSRRVTNASYYLGDANGENGQLVYSKSMPAAMGNHSYDYTNLTPGTTYTIWYTLSSAVGTTTSPKYVITPGTPSAPTNMRATPGNGSVTITWDEPSNKNGATIAGYNIYHGNGATTPGNGSTLNTSRSYTVKGTNGFDILSGNSFWIAAVTSEGKEGTRGAISGNVRVGSPQPVANACCIMLNS